MKPNNFLLAGLLVLGACSKPSSSPLLISHLEKIAGEEVHVTQRALASADGNRCLKDVFTVDVIKSEIKELEKKYKAGTAVEGKWKHLNLASLPIAQANFLKSYGDKMGDLGNPNAFDYSSCSDVPCVFNKIYGKEDGVAGYVHYLWYLKMGNLLAATNNVYQSKSQTKPGIYNGKNFAISSYLYRDSEIYGFWRLLMMMKEPHTTLAEFKEIHRVPQGESFDFEFEKRRAGKASLGETCGLAYSSGYVILQDLCLTLYSDWESGNFYESVLHEFNHQVDYHQGRKLRKSYRSGEQDYLNVSSFYLKEYKDETNRIVRQWEHKEGIKLVSSYAGTSPAENFAETLSLFRVDGSRTKNSISTDHWDFVSKNYYSDKNFEKQSLIKSWLKSNGPTLTQRAFSAVGDCSKTSQNYASTFYKKTDFSTSVFPSMINCLGAKSQDLSLELRSKIKVSDPDGCKTLSENETKNTWDPLLKGELVSLLEKYLKELQADKTYFAKIQTFIDDVPNKAMATNAYLACAEIETEETCYQEGVLRLALEKLVPLNLPEAHAHDLADLYLAGHPISETKQYLNSFYKSFVASHRAQIEREAEFLWSQCASLPLLDETPPTGKYFTLNDGYLVSSQYNCLNKDFLETASLIVKNLSANEASVQHPKEEILLRDEVIPELEKSLIALYDKNRILENKSIQEFILNDKGLLRKQVTTSFDWVRDVLSNTNVIRDCQSFALTKIDLPLRYHIRLESFRALLDISCFDITSSSEYRGWLDQSKTAFQDKSLSSLEKRILDLALARTKACRDQYPMDTNLNRIKFKKDREECLVKEWPQIEAIALKEYEADPMVVKYKIDVNRIKTQLDTNRRRLQLRLIKENF